MEDNKEVVAVEAMGNNEHDGPTPEELEGIEGFTEADVKTVCKPKKCERNSEGTLLLIGVLLGVFLMLLLIFFKDIHDAYHDVDAGTKDVTEEFETEEKIENYYAVWTGTVNGTLCHIDADGTGIYHVNISGCFVDIDATMYEELGKIMGKTIRLTASETRQGTRTEEFYSYVILE